MRVRDVSHVITWCGCAQTLRFWVRSHQAGMLFTKKLGLTK